MCSVNFLLDFNCWSTLELFYIIYKPSGLNHLSMVITFLLKVIGWRFPEILTRVIILCEPLLRRYT